ncbi:FHA domain-containing protein [Arthrobacter sp. H5]|uniref:FHA domain-containing protein n=1 Tax=Arthrobacter sp. H5 TaxID=1267973 RepID=UPI0004B95CA6|nr:FHA domain-containing protein [Arthrobacter sp. H5]
MSVIRYSSGDWLCTVRSGLLILLPAGTSQETLDRLWEVMESTPQIHAVLPVVSGGFDAGLTAMPAFGVVSFSGRLHAVLRGALTLSAAGDNGPVELSGEKVTTWTERILDQETTGFTLWAGQSTSHAGTPLLALESGTVWAGSVTVSVGTGAAAQAPGGQPPAASVSADDAEDSATINPGLFLTTTAAEPDDSEDDAPQIEQAQSDQPQSDAPQGDAPQIEQSQIEQAQSDQSLAGQPGDGAPSAAQSDDDGPMPGSDVSDADQEPTSGPDYDHLWEQTVVRRVEDAAVRPVEEDEDGGPATEDNAVALESSEKSSDNLEHASSPAAAAEDREPSVDAGAAQPIPGAAAPIAAEPVPAPAGLLIDSVPWSRGSSPSAAQPVKTPPEPSRAPAREPAAVRETPSSSVPRPAGTTGEQLGDHDGQTIMRSDLSGIPAAAAPAEDPKPGTGPLVLARLCPQGHANPPESSGCGICSQPLGTETQQVRRPSLGRMRVSTGEVIELDQPLIVGRQPSVSRVQGSGMPKLVQVRSDSGDISRSHVEVRLDGWHVLLCDLRATNGTVLIREGQPARRLGEGESAFLLDGDIAQLGEDVSLRFEDLR